MSDFLRAVAKYSEDQPRAPAGSPDGGQWIARVDAVLPEERGDTPKKPGELITVYRLSHAPVLHGNAANAEGMARFLYNMDDYEQPSPAGFTWDGAVLHVFQIPRPETWEEFRAISGRGPVSEWWTNPVSGKLIRRTMLPGRTDKGGERYPDRQYWYSFPTPMDAVPVASIPIERVREALEARHGAANFDAHPEPRVRDVIREVALRHVLKKFDPDQPRAPAGSPEGGQWVKVGAENLRAEGYSSAAKLREDGVILTSNVDDAVRALTDGRAVELNQVREVATLLDRLAAMAKDAEARGAKAPVYDLCKVSVAGTNLFCAGALGIPRAQMPQFLGIPQPGSPADALPRRASGKVDIAPAFKEYLQSHGHTVEDTDESVAYLRASQNQLNGAKVGQMMGWLRTKSSPYGDAPPLVVSADNYIIDGHHRWAALVGLDSEDGSLGDLRIPVQRVSIKVIDLIREANAFADFMGTRRTDVDTPMAKRDVDGTQPRDERGRWADTGATLRGPQNLTIETWEYKRPGVRHQSKLAVLWNPTRDELKRWAADEVREARFLNVDGNRVFWNAYEALHQQVAAATGLPYSGAANPDYKREGQLTVRELRDPHFDFLFDGVRKSWLSTVLEFVGLAKWDESQVHRGKTTPESNSGSFAPRGAGVADPDVLTVDNVRVPLYHGGVDDVLHVILRDGIKPGSETGVRRWPQSFYMNEKRATAVYATTTPEHAVTFAKSARIQAFDYGERHAEARPPTSAVVFKVTVPEDVYKQAAQDELLGPGFLRIPQSIPPEWIDGYVRVDDDFEWWAGTYEQQDRRYDIAEYKGYQRVRKAEGRTLYTVVLITESVEKRDWDEDEHPRGKTVEGTNAGSFRPRNTGFVSPNIDENVDFTEAASRIQSHRTRLLLQANEEVSEYFGTNTHDTVGVGAWADGAEQSLIVDGSGDFEAFKAHMALSGLLADQKAVVAFTNDAKGPDSMYRLSVGNRPLKDVHAALLEAGVEFHTLRKTDHNVDVFVFSPGTEKGVQDAVGKAAEHFGVDEVDVVNGYGEFIGSWDSREDGRRAYEAVLDAYEGKVPQRDGGWKALRDRWLPRLAAVRKSGAHWLEVVAKYSPDQPRGKTTDASNDGSFTFTSRDSVASEVQREYRELAARLDAPDATEADRDRFLELGQQRRAAQRDWAERVTSAVATGKLSLAQATALGFDPPGGNAGLKPLPAELWHVTTAADRLTGSELKTQHALAGDYTPGLGGSMDHVVSFTESEAYADAIRDTLVLARQVARGDTTIAELDSRAAAGEGAPTEWRSRIKEYFDRAGEYAHIMAGTRPVNGPFDAQRAGVVYAGGKPQNVPADWTVVNDYEFVRPATAEERAEDAERYLKAWLAFRGEVGGPENPLMAFNDMRKLAALPEGAIGVVRVSTASGSMGWHYPWEHEYRTHPAAVRVAEIRKRDAGPRWLHTVAKREWDESSVVRGKTTPESNSGSFAPAGTQIPDDVAQVLRGWTQNDQQWAWSDMQHAAQYALSGEPPQDYVLYDYRGDDKVLLATAQRVIAYLNEAPPPGRPLYRGLHGKFLPRFRPGAPAYLDEPVRAFNVGDEFSESLTSWTGKKALAKEFADDAYSGEGFRSPRRGTVLVLDPAGARAVSISQLADPQRTTLREADEWVASGRYRVTSVEVGADGARFVHVARVGAARSSDLVKDWDESKVVRGKTTPESTPGSFAPKGTQGELFGAPPRGVPRLNAAKQSEARKALRVVAAELGVDDAVLAKAEEHLRQALSTARVAINRSGVESVTDLFVGSGRMKTQFETGTSSGLNNKRRRAEVEQQLFGIPADYLTDPQGSPEARPVYGYLIAAGTDPYHIDYEQTGDYGNFRFVLKPEVRERTTWTEDDSLRAEDLYAHWPSSVTNPELHTLVQRSTLETWARTKHDLLAELLPPDGDPSRPPYLSMYQQASYLEAQVHGQVRKEDIAELHVGERLFASLGDDVREEIARLGIRVVFHEAGDSDGYGGYL